MNVRYGFVIDLKRCYGCYSCTVACKAANNTPKGIDFAKCLQAEVGTYPAVSRQMLPTLCMQCEEPACKEVCPTGATTQDENGIVQVDKALCMGCKACMMACPYGQRHVVSEWSTYFPGERVQHGVSEPKELDAYEAYCKAKWEQKYGYGVAAKCTFCIDRIKEGRQPNCVQSCPAKARYIGDLNDPNSEVSILIRRERGFQLNPELGTEPRVYYLPPR